MSFDGSDAPSNAGRIMEGNLSGDWDKRATANFKVEGMNEIERTCFVGWSTVRIVVRHE